MGKEIKQELNAPPAYVFQNKFDLNLLCLCFLVWNIRVLSVTKKTANYMKSYGEKYPGILSSPDLDTKTKLAKQKGSRGRAFISIGGIIL